MEQMNHIQRTLLIAKTTRAHFLYENDLKFVFVVIGMEKVIGLTWKSRAKKRYFCFLYHTYDNLQNLHHFRNMIYSTSWFLVNCRNIFISFKADFIEKFTNRTFVDILKHALYSIVLHGSQELDHRNLKVFLLSYNLLFLRMIKVDTLFYFPWYWGICSDMRWLARRSP